MTSTTKIKASVGDIFKDPRMVEDTGFPPGIAVKPPLGVKLLIDGIYAIVSVRLQDPARDGYNITYIISGKTYNSFATYYQQDILTWTWEEADGSYTPIEDDYDRTMKSMGFK